MNDNNAPHYTELPIAPLEKNKGQIDGLPATPRNIQPDKFDKLYEELRTLLIGTTKYEELKRKSIEYYAHFQD